jgi:hypothetical protein
MIRPQRPAIRKGATVVAGLFASTLLWLSAHPLGLDNNLFAAFQAGPPQAGRAPPRPLTAARVLEQVNGGGDDDEMVVPPGASSPSMSIGAQLTASVTVDPRKEIKLSKMLVQSCQSRPGPDIPFKQVGSVCPQLFALNCPAQILTFRSNRHPKETAQPASLAARHQPSITPPLPTVWRSGGACCRRLSTCRAPGPAPSPL